MTDRFDLRLNAQTPSSMRWRRDDGALDLESEVRDAHARGSALYRPENFTAAAITANSLPCASLAAFLPMFPP